MHNAIPNINTNTFGQVYRRNRHYLIRTNEGFQDVSDFTHDVLARNHSSTDKQVNNQHTIVC
ncbi:hypothetical protein DPMN_045099 [Dreissena polymorpha]|uniref:Uncharacterized protein n=1 Tax=Dreissena polymorpha TaxID=45954 RepID=A0A9D4D4F3_DREPO|nr:hypothetical protein DPMN_045099 [Dreissena polymorpha]